LRKLLVEKYIDQGEKPPANSLEQPICPVSKTHKKQI
jgi:hypothetical protein